MKINHAMFASRDELNSFTEELRQSCIESDDGKVLVILRNKSYVSVMFSDESNTFHTENWDLCWNANGSSLKNRELDIVAM
jgi:hypothetical protein